MDGRFEYSDAAGCGFAELAPRKEPTSQELFTMLEQVEGVSAARWNTSKTSQGNPGDHYMVNNIIVTSDLAPGSADHPFEFELTRCQHMAESQLPFTVTAMLKETNPDLAPEGWRILCEVVQGRELFPKTH